MGAEPYTVVVPYDPDIQRALDRARQQVFESGEFLGAERSPPSIEAVLEMVDEDGTGSILDIMEISDEPDLCTACPFPPDELEEYFGTAQPNLAQVEASDEIWDAIDRGTARYIILYTDGSPSHIFFAGYSLD